MAAKSKPNEIYIERIYDAPVKAVWDAWTDPEQVAKWWGPRGFSITTHSKELKPGGHWKYTMHGPDGVDWPNHTVYYEVEKHAKLVYDHGGNDKQPPLFRVTVTFKETNGKTHMAMWMALDTVEKATETKKFIKQASGNSTWDRLAEYLEKESSGKETFVINRTFQTNVNTMWEMWTDFKHFNKWMGPAGSTIEIIRGEQKIGNEIFYCMKMTGAPAPMYGKFKYIEMQKPNRLVYSQQFANADGSVARHPAAPTWPETMKTTVNFIQEGPNETRINLTWECIGNVTKEEMETFIMGRAGMTGGWTGSFDKLEEYLA